MLEREDEALAVAERHIPFEEDEDIDYDPEEDKDDSFEESEEELDEKYGE